MNTIETFYSAREGEAERDVAGIRQKCLTRVLVQDMEGPF